MGPRVTLDDVRTAAERIRPSADQVVAEASGARGIGAPGSGRVRPADGRPVVAVISGANIDVGVLSRLLAART